MRSRKQLLKDLDKDINEIAMSGASKIPWIKSITEVVEGKRKRTKLTGLDVLINNNDK